MKEIYEMHGRGHSARAIARAFGRPSNVPRKETLEAGRRALAGSAG